MRTDLPRLVKTRMRFAPGAAGRRACAFPFSRRETARMRGAVASPPRHISVRMRLPQRYGAGRHACANERTYAARAARMRTGGGGRRREARCPPLWWRGAVTGGSLRARLCGVIRPVRQETLK